jgi:hypothetical protein
MQALLPLSHHRPLALFNPIIMGSPGLPASGLPESKLACRSDILGIRVVVLSSRYFSLDQLRAAQRVKDRAGECTCNETRTTSGLRPGKKAVTSPTTCCQKRRHAAITSTTPRARAGHGFPGLPGPLPGAYSMLRW